MRFLNPFSIPEVLLETNDRNEFRLQRITGGRKLFHQQHLSSAFDGAVQLTLVVGRQPGVFAWENTALIGDELLEQVDIFKIKRIESEIDFGLGPRSPVFHRAFATGLIFVFVYFTWHKKLFNFAMKCVTAERGIKFFYFQLFRL